MLATLCIKLHWVSTVKAIICKPSTLGLTSPTAFRLNLGDKLEGLIISHHSSQFAHISQRVASARLLFIFFLWTNTTIYRLTIIEGSEKSWGGSKTEEVPSPLVNSSLAMKVTECDLKLFPATECNLQLFPLSLTNLEGLNVEPSSCHRCDKKRFYHSATAHPWLVDCQIPSYCIFWTFFSPCASVLSPDSMKYWEWM